MFVRKVKKNFYIKNNHPSTSTQQGNNLEQNIERNKEIGFIATWGPLFSVSFDLMITSFENEAWTDILAFKANGAVSDKAIGDRIPAILLQKTGFIWFVNLINGEQTGSAAMFKVDVELNKWYHIALQQKRNTDKVRKGVNLFLLGKCL